MKKKRPQISIIVPIYKVEKYLPQCIESLLGQTLRDIEIILVDDGSPDGSPRLCEEAAAQDARVKVIHKKNDGLLEARKSGAAVAAGTYIGFVDGDDWIAPEYYQKLYEAAVENDADMVCAGFCQAYEDGRREYITETAVPLGLYDRAAMEKTVFPKLICAEKTCERTINSTCSKIYRQEIFCKYGLKMPKALGTWEDGGFTKAAALASERVLYLPYNDGYFYRQVQDSMSRVYRLGRREHVLAARAFLKEVVRQEAPLPTLYAQLDRMVNYFGGVEVLMAEIQPNSPLGWRQLRALCREVFAQPEGAGPLLRTAYGSEKVMDLCCKSKNAALTATAILLLRQKLRWQASRAETVK